MSVRQLLNSNNTFTIKPYKPFIKYKGRKINLPAIINNYTPLYTNGEVLYYQTGRNTFEIIPLNRLYYNAVMNELLLREKYKNGMQKVMNELYGRPKSAPPKPLTRFGRVSPNKRTGLHCILPRKTTVSRKKN